MGEKARMMKATTLMGLKPTLPKIADIPKVFFSFMANIQSFPLYFHSLAEQAGRLEQKNHYDN